MFLCMMDRREALLLVDRLKRRTRDPEVLTLCEYVHVVGRQRRRGKKDGAMGAETPLAAELAGMTNTVGPSCYRSPPRNSLPAQLPFGRLIEIFIFWMCELSHTTTQFASVS